MADTTSSVKVSLDADLTGGMQTEQQLDKIRKKARELGSDGAAAGNRMSAAFGKVSSAAGMFQKALTGFGIAGAFAGVVAAIERIGASFGGAKKEAEEFAKAQSQAAHKKDIEELAKGYERLGEAIQASAAATQHANEMLDINVKNSRDLEDAQLALAEQRDLADVDANDPAAAEKKALIQARYAARRGETTALRQKNDIGIAQHKLLSEADAKRQAADEIEASVGADDEAIRKTAALFVKARNAATTLNDDDNTGFWSMFGSNIKRIATLEWGKFNDVRTDAGDARRKEARGEASGYAAQLNSLTAAKAEKLKKAEQLRQEAAMAEEKANALGGGIDVANVQSEVAELSGRVTVAAAARAREKKEEQVAKDQRTVSSGKARTSELKSKAESEEARAQAARDAYAKEQADVFKAQGRYDMLVANGGNRKATSAALAALQKEQAEAQEAQHEMEVVTAQVANTLKNIKDEIGKLSQAVKSAQNRIAQNQADAPEG